MCFVYDVFIKSLKRSLEQHVPSLLWPPKPKKATRGLRSLETIPESSDPKGPLTSFKKDVKFSVYQGKDLDSATKKKPPWLGTVGRGVMWCFEKLSQKHCVKKHVGAASSRWISYDYHTKSAMAWWWKICQMYVQQINTQSLAPPICFRSRKPLACFCQADTTANATTGGGTVWMLGFPVVWDVTRRSLQCEAEPSVFESQPKQSSAQVGDCNFLAGP